MERHDVTLFKAYPFRVGQRIRIEGSRRRGDWEVIEVTEDKVSLRCPVSHREVSWARFCYHVEDRVQEWPLRDGAE